MEDVPATTVASATPNGASGAANQTSNDDAKIVGVQGEILAGPAPPAGPEIPPLDLTAEPDIPLVRESSRDSHVGPLPNLPMPSNVCPLVRTHDGKLVTYAFLNGAVSLTDGERSVQVTPGAVPAREWRLHASNAVRDLITTDRLPLWLKPSMQSSDVKTPETKQELDSDGKTPRMSDEEWERTIRQNRMVEVHVNKQTYWVSDAGYILDAKNRSTLPPARRRLIMTAYAQQAAAQIHHSDSASVASTSSGSVSARTERSAAPPVAAEADLCAICRGDMVGVHYPFTVSLPCGHKFHRECVVRLAEHDARCPTCRQPHAIIRDLARAHNAQLARVAAGGPFPPGDLPGWPDDPDEPPAPPVPDPAPGNGFIVRTDYYMSAATIAAARHIGVHLIPGDRTHPHAIHAASRTALLHNLEGRVGPLLSIGLNPEHIGNMDIIPNTYNRYDQNFHGRYNGPVCQCDPSAACEHGQGHRHIVHYCKPEYPLAATAQRCLEQGQNHFFVIDNEVRSARQELGCPDQTEDERANDDHKQSLEGLLYVCPRGTVAVTDLSSRREHVYPYPMWQHTQWFKDAMDRAWRVNKLETMKDMALWEFVYQPNARVIETPNLSFAAAAADRNHVGPLRMSFHQDVADPSVHIRGDPRSVMVYSHLDSFVFDFEDNFGVFMPKEVLASVMAAAVHMARTPQVTAAVRSMLSRGLQPYGLQPSENLKTLTVGVPLCLTQNLLNEERAWNQHVMPSLRLVERLRAAYSYLPETLTSIMVSPISEASYAQLQRLCRKIGTSILRYPYQIAVASTFLTLALASITLYLLGPGERLPATRTVGETAWHWLTGAQSTVVALGSQAYALTFPECASYFTRRLAMEPACRMLNGAGEWYVVETLRHAWYFRVATHTAAVWTFFGMILFDETLKRRRLGYGQDDGYWILVFFETMWKFSHFPFFTALGSSIVVAYLHAVLKEMDFWKAVSFHMVWNMTAVMFALDNMKASLGTVEAVAIVTMYAFVHHAYATAVKNSQPMQFGPQYEVGEATNPIDAGAVIQFATKPRAYDPTKLAFTQMGPLVPHCLPVVPATTSVNLYSALRKRHLYPKLPQVFNRAQLRREYKRAMDMLPTPTSVHDFLDPTSMWFRSRNEWLSKFTLAQRMPLERAIVDLQMIPFKPGYAKHHRCFTKKEKLLEPGKMPRLILTVTPHFSVVVGPALWSISKWLLENWDNLPVMYAAGASRERISAWFKWHARSGNYILSDDDEQKCDSSYRKENLKEMTKFYIRFFVRFIIIHALNKSHDRCILHGNDGTFAAVDGTMSTGSNETSVGNTLFVILKKLAAWVPVALAQQQKTHMWTKLQDTPDHVLGILQAGDDGVNAVRKDVVVNYLDLNRFGMRIKHNPRAHHWHVQFLSGRFYPIGEDYVWGPKPGRQIVKLGADIEHDENSRAKMRGVALGLRCIGNHVPLLGTLVNRILELTHGVEAKAIWEEWKPQTNVAYDADDRTYEMFCTVYGLNPLEVADCEAYLSQVGLYDFLSHPVLEKVIDIDLE